MKLRTLLKLASVRTYSFRNFSNKLVLGIETSCDDTGAAVVDEHGVILGEGYESQMKIHLLNGGVIPHIAMHFHQEHIEDVVSTALAKSKVKIPDISAIAVTTKPGLRGPLTVGIEYAKKLAKDYGKPVIPIHHMEAHALTPRLNNDVQFPFLALLASGGHCQLTLVRGINEFLLLGNSFHNSPGEVLDKIARRLKLHNLPPCYEMSGGKAIEFMSEGGNPTAYNVPVPMVQYRDCNFSFSGFSSFATSTIEKEEQKYDVEPDGVIPGVRDFCASILHGYALHMIHRVHRAFLYCELKNLMDKSQRTLVFSGGVACNSYIRKAVEQSCFELNSKYFAPPLKLCNDNGIMIAWNGMEKLKANVDILTEFENLAPDANCPLGINITKDVQEASIKVKLPKLNIVSGKENVELRV